MSKEKEFLDIVCFLANETLLHGKADSKQYSEFLIAMIKHELNEKLPDYKDIVICALKLFVVNWGTIEELCDLKR